MRKIDDYIPVELFHEAKDFVRQIDDDVEIYKKIRQIGAIAQDEKANKFTAYWTFEKYEEFPHALITLYENKPDIDSEVYCCGVENAFETLQLRMHRYYELLEENGMANE